MIYETKASIDILNLAYNRYIGHIIAGYDCKILVFNCVVSNVLYQWSLKSAEKHYGEILIVYFTELNYIWAIQTLPIVVQLSPAGVFMEKSVA